jgi:hypothetical protein
LGSLPVKPMVDRSNPGFWTHTRTCVVLAFAFALLSWSIAAASYSKYIEAEGQPGYEVLGWLSTSSLGRQVLLVRLAAEGINQLPNIHHVVSYAIWEKPWLAGIFVGLELVPLAAWFLLHRVERELATPRRRR